MKFLADQDVYAITIGFPSGLEHDVVRAAQLGLAQAEDAELLRVAHELGSTHSHIAPSDLAERLTIYSPASHARMAAGSSPNISDPGTI